MATAVVVGGGPNGLTAAAVLARAGVRVTVLEAAAEVGGGVRSGEFDLPGVVHDHCSAVHPIAAGSPVFADLGLAAHGLRWRWPRVDCAHPLDDGRAATLLRSLDATAAGLGADGRPWRTLFGPVSRRYDALAEDLFRPLAHVPRHPVALSSFGTRALLPASTTARLLRTPAAKALYGGIAAHTLHPLEKPMTSAIGLMLIAAAHRWGWPVAEGGSMAIATALTASLRADGATIETGVRITSAAELPRADLTLFDLAPRAVAEILGDRLPPRVARAYRRYRHGPGAFKVDFAVHGGVPWLAKACRDAGTVHLGGTFEEIAAAERDIALGRLPARPFVLVGQQYLADPSRSRAGVHPIWTYAHVPHGFSGDATEAIVARVEQYAPGFRERVVGQYVRSTTAMSEYNPNYVGGDIVTGMNSVRQLLMRPRPGLDPYATGIPGVYVCSAATPPGAGAHGLCGANAAKSALRHLRA